MADSSSKRRSVDLPGRHLKLKLVLGPGFPARNLLKRNQAESKRTGFISSIIVKLIFLVWNERRRMDNCL